MSHIPGARIAIIIICIFISPPDLFSQSNHPLDGGSQSSLAVLSDSTESKAIQKIGSKYYETVDARISRAESSLTKKSKKYLKKLSKLEQALRKKVAAKDSSLAVQLFSGREGLYQITEKVQLPTQASALTLAIYSSNLDTLKMTLRFLANYKDILHITDDKNLTTALGHLGDLNSSLSANNAMADNLRGRLQELSRQLSGIGFTKELQKINKELYYYNSLVKEWKNTFNEPRKLEAVVLDQLKKLNVFQKFLENNSELALLFGSINQPAGSNYLSGLQNRSQVAALINQRMPQNVQAASFIGDQMRRAKDELSKVAKLDNTSMVNDLPGFKVNNQKNKPFLKRLEYDVNIQSSKATNFLPTTSDLGIGIGYKLNDNNVAGLGLSYKLGIGPDIRHIKLTHEGISLRAFLDMKLKKSFYISGGYEQNYRSSFKDFQELKDYSAWQQSALIGLSKKFRVSSKLKANARFLFDCLYKKNIPHTQPVIFRIGYNL